MKKRVQQEMTDLFSDSCPSPSSSSSPSPDNKRVKELENIITHLDTCYEDGKDCVNPVTGEVVLDNEYDAMKAELFLLAPKSFIFDTVTASTHLSAANKVIHNPPMTSINKCNGTEDEKNKILLKWFQDCFGIKYSCVPDTYDGVAISYKHDGLALSLIYEQGKLIRAGLRSKSGLDGIDVTDKTKYIKDIPQVLPLPLTCVIRGEVETPISVFDKVSQALGSNAKTNPRSHTAGSMNLKVAEDVKDRGLQFIAYSIIGLGTKYYKTEIERAAFAHFKLKLQYVRMSAFILKNLKHLEEIHRTLDYKVDGVVLSVNDLALQESLGTTGDKDTGNPKGKIAFKFADDVQRTVVIKTIWQTGRTGNVTPVLIIDPVQLEGTTVSKCTAHNLGIIKQNNIGDGSIIEIIKSGKIIPKIHKVITPGKKPVVIPTKCPSCDGILSQETGANDALSLVCKNIDCPAQNIKTLDHYLSVIGIKGIAESTINKLIENGSLKNRADFYRIRYEDLVASGMPERSSVLIEARIQMIHDPEDDDTDKLISQIKTARTSKKKIPLHLFFAALGISGAGKEVGRILSQNFGSLSEIRNAESHQLEKIDGIGPITAVSIVDFFKQFSKEMDDLLNYVQVESKTSSGKLKGKSFVLSGSLDGGKEKWQKIIEDEGGIIKSSVGKSVDYLIAGEGSGSKSDKAKELHISILTTADFEKMLG